MKTTTLSDQALAAQTAQQNREPMALISKLMDRNQYSLLRAFQQDHTLKLDF